MLHPSDCDLFLFIFVIGPGRRRRRLLRCFRKTTQRARKIFVLVPGQPRRHRLPRGFRPRGSRRAATASIFLSTGAPVPRGSGFGRQGSSDILPPFLSTSFSVPSKRFGVRSWRLPAYRFLLDGVQVVRICVSDGRGAQYLARSTRRFVYYSSSSRQGLERKSKLRSMHVRVRRRKIECIRRGEECQDEND